MHMQNNKLIISHTWDLQNKIKTNQIYSLVYNEIKLIYSKKSVPYPRIDFAAREDIKKTFLALETISSNN